MTRIPEMLFRVLKLELLDFTLFRAPRDWNANSFMSGAPSTHRDGTPYDCNPKGLKTPDVKACHENKTRLNSLPEFSTVELPEVLVEKEVKQGSGCEIWFKGRIPGLTPPSFQSFAITRSYRIKVKIRTEIGGKEFDFTAEEFEVEIGSA